MTADKSVWKGLWEQGYATEENISPSPSNNYLHLYPQEKIMPFDGIPSSRTEY